MRYILFLVYRLLKAYLGDNHTDTLGFQYPLQNIFAVKLTLSYWSASQFSDLSHTFFSEIAVLPCIVWIVKRWKKVLILSDNLHVFANVGDRFLCIRKKGFQVNACFFIDISKTEKAKYKVTLRRQLVYGM